MNIVKIEAKKSFTDIKMQHTIEILEGNQVENKCLKYWLEVLEQKKESSAEVNDQHTDDVFEMSEEEGEWMKSLLKRIAVNEMEMSQVLAKTEADISLLNYVMLTNIQSSVSDYVVPIRKLRDK